MSTTLTTLPAPLPALREEPKPSRRTDVLLVSILLLAVSVRLAWRVHKGGPDFWVNGYSFFYDLASNVAAGNGLYIEGGGWAMRMPAYPLFLALTALVGKNYLWIIIPQAIMGAGTVLCAFLIGRELFGQTTGILASILTALYPYYVVHDTALQETGMFTFMTALSVFLLLKARRGSSLLVWTLAGLALGAAVLTRQTLAPFGGAALLWLILFGEGSRRQRLLRCAAVFLPLSVMVGSWLARNYRLVGAPVLTSEFGRQLWNANNAKTFSHYPGESIDRSAGEAFAAFTPTERRQLDALGDNEIRESDWFLRKGLGYITDHPLETLQSGARKIAAGFSWSFNPTREPLVQLTYLFSYAPISILGSLGMILTWRQWREHGPIYLLFLTFTAVTAIFWAHTSHRSYLDIYWMVFAAYVLNRLFGQRVAAWGIAT